VGSLVLIVVGVVLLLQTTGVVPWRLWSSLWRLWPVFIVLMGLNMLLGRRLGWLAGLLTAAVLLASLGLALALMEREQPLTVTTLVEPLGGLRSAEARISFGPGDLTVRSLPPASPNLVEGLFEAPGRGAEATLQRRGDAGELVLRRDRSRWLIRSSPSHWDLALAREVKWTIELDAGASSIRLDLGDLLVTSLDVDAGAANLSLTLPANAGPVTVTVDAGAADIRITVPPGVAARIRRSSGLSSFDVDTSRFPKAGDVYASPGFDAAPNRVSLDLRVGAASVSVR